MSCCLGMDFFPTNFMLQHSHHEHEDDHQPSTTLSSLFPQSFHETILSHEEVSDEEGSQMGGKKYKKRRLKSEQVKALEKSFEVGKKLEPERKMQLARALGLQPRQIAIWFQNRRARWKTKQLETDYESLKKQFDAVKAQNQALLAHNQQLHAQIMALKNNRDNIDDHHHDQPKESINLNKETAEGSCSNRSENSSEMMMRRSTAAIDSHQSTRSSLTMRSPPAAGMAHLFHSSSSSNSRLQPSDVVINQSLKMGPVSVKVETLSNLFCGNDNDHSGFWPWLEQHHFN